MQEELFPIKDYEERYSITKTGKFWSYERNIFKKTYYDVWGYKRVALCRHNKIKSTLIHRLLAQTFIPNPDNKKTINHKNGIKDDNRLENLEWCTQKENIQHAHKTGLCKNRACGEKNGSSKLTDEKVIKIYNMHKEGYSVEELSKNFNVTIQTIYSFLGGKTWKHIKYIKE